MYEERHELYYEFVSVITINLFKQNIIVYLNLKIEARNLVIPLVEYFLDQFTIKYKLHGGK
jgi:hypothetical protein